MTDGFALAGLGPDLSRLGGASVDRVREGRDGSGPNGFAALMDGPRDRPSRSADVPGRIGDDGPAEPEDDTRPADEDIDGEGAESGPVPAQAAPDPELPGKAREPASASPDVTSAAGRTGAAQALLVASEGLALGETRGFMTPPAPGLATGPAAGMAEPGQSQGDIDLTSDTPEADGEVEGLPARGGSGFRREATMDGILRGLAGSGVASWATVDVPGQDLAARGERAISNPTPASSADRMAKVAAMGPGSASVPGSWPSPAAASAALAYGSLRAETGRSRAQQGGPSGDATGSSQLGATPLGKGLDASAAGGPEVVAPSAGKQTPKGTMPDDPATEWLQGKVHKDEAKASRPATSADSVAVSRRMATDGAPVPGPGLPGHDSRRTGAAEGWTSDAPILAGPPSGTGSAGPAAPSEVPSEARRIARQVASHPVFRTGGSAEVSLAPKELGHLRLSVEMGDGGLRVIIEAARPETCDLMRRHVEALRQELRQEGLGSVSVSISGGDGRRGEEQAPGGRQTGPWSAFGDRTTAAESGPSDLPSSRPASAAGHLDLRF